MSRYEERNGVKKTNRKQFMEKWGNQIARWINSEVAKLQGSKNLFCVIQELMKKVTMY